MKTPTKTLASRAFFTLALLALAPASRGQDAAPALRNPSFEFAGSKPEEIPGWGLWGGGLERVDSWSPTHTGDAMIGYKHWVIRDVGDSGLFQDASSIAAGANYEFSVWIYVDKAERNGFGGVELRLESGVDGRQVTVATTTVAGADIPTGRWSKLAVRGTAPVGNLRVVIVCFPSLDEPRDGAVKIDDAQIVRLP